MSQAESQDRKSVVEGKSRNVGPGRPRLKQPSLTIPKPMRFITALDAAVIDHYVRRNKSSRNYPRKKSDPPCGPPAILKATRQQKQIAQRLKSGLTA
jgi:hypothetical protein